MTPLESLVASGTKLWLDSVDPDGVEKNLAWGATGATSNPIIIADLVETGRFDADMKHFLRESEDDGALAWKMTDALVRRAQEKFLPAWERSKGDTGYVSFELDPLLEDPDRKTPVAERTRRYIELGKQWSAGHRNRMIKVPATEGGLAALEELAAAGVTLNVTPIFSERQYDLARDAIWRGAQRRKSLDGFKSVYSIFVSRVDVYTDKEVPNLSPAAQGQVGIVGAKRLWQSNQKFWSTRKTRLHQEIIFASTGTKKKEDPPWKYVQALAGSDIQTNPPATSEAVQKSGLTFTRKVDEMPPAAVLAEIDAKVDVQKMEDQLMREGELKFADPQKVLLKLIADKRKSLATQRA